MTRLRTRMRLNGSDAGVGSLEYLGIILLAGLVVMGLLLSATPIGSKLAEKMCEAFGTSCPAATAQIEAEKAPPTRTCERGSVASQSENRLGVSVVNVDADSSFSLIELSDGTYVVELAGEGGLGADIGPGGLKASLAVGETFDVGYELSAGVGGGLLAGNVKEFRFDNLEDAQEFAVTASISRVSQFVPGVDGISRIFGNKPPEPNAETFYGGVEGSADATANLVTGGGSAEANLQNIIGTQVDYDAREVTTFIDISANAEIAGQLGLSRTNTTIGGGGEAGAEGQLVLEVTTAESGKPTNLSITGFGGYKYGESMREFLELADESVDEHTLHRLQMDLDITDGMYENVGDFVNLALQAGTGSEVDREMADEAKEIGEDFFNQVVANGDITHEVMSMDTKNNFAAALGGDIFRIGGSISTSNTERTMELQEARYLSNDGWQTWEACIQ